MTREQMDNLEAYGNLSAKILKNCIRECERIGKIFLDEYKNRQSKTDQKLITEGDALFLHFFKEWTDLLYGVQILCGNNLHRNAIPTVRTMAKYSILSKLSSVGNTDFAFVTFRSCRLNPSMALVV